MNAAHYFCAAITLAILSGIAGLCGLVSYVNELETRMDAAEEASLSDEDMQDTQRLGP